LIKEQEKSGWQPGCESIDAYYKPDIEIAAVADCSGLKYPTLTTRSYCRSGLSAVGLPGYRSIFAGCDRKLRYRHGCPACDSYRMVCFTAGRFCDGRGLNLDETGGAAPAHPARASVRPGDFGGDHDRCATAVERADCLGQRAAQ